MQTRGLLIWFAIPYAFSIPLLVVNWLAWHDPGILEVGFSAPIGDFVLRALSGIGIFIGKDSVLLFLYYRFVGMRMLIAWSAIFTAINAIAFMHDLSVYIGF